MKKLFVLFLMLVVCSLAFSADMIVGVGSPYSVKPEVSGQFYFNKSNSSMWKSNGTEIGDWELVVPTAGNGSEQSPFEALAMNSVKFVPITDPATPTLYMLFVSSDTADLMFGVASGSGASMTPVWKKVTLE